MLTKFKEITHWGGWEDSSFNFMFKAFIGGLFLIGFVILFAIMYYLFEFIENLSFPMWISLSLIVLILLAGLILIFKIAISFFQFLKSKNWKITDFTLEKKI